MKQVESLPIPEKFNLITLSLVQQGCQRQLPMVGLQTENLLNLQLRIFNPMKQMKGDQKIWL